MSYMVELVIKPIIYFCVIFLAARVAISPLIKNGKMFGLIKSEHMNKMKVIGILNENEIRKYHEMQGREDKLDKNALEYRHFKDVLERLRDSGLIEDMEFERKMIKLNKYYSFD